MSHANDLPASQGISVLPSEHLPLSLTNPDGSVIIIFILFFKNYFGPSAQSRPQALEN